MGCRSYEFAEYPGQAHVRSGAFGHLTEHEMTVNNESANVHSGRKIIRLPAMPAKNTMIAAKARTLVTRTPIAG